MRRQLITPIIALAALTLAACGSSNEHARFTTKIDNEWLPLKPGTTLVYEGTKDGKRQRDVFTVTHRTKTLGGAPCVVVDDRVYSGGHLGERTTDYYSQDSKGNVWYFGEDTAELDARGRVTSTEGTWHTGVNGARAGLFMPAHPRVGEQHRQEYLRGHAEDQFRVVSLAAHIKVPAGDYGAALETNEWTKLEPDVLDAKYYVRGVGEVFEGSLKGPREVFRLVSVKRP
ncbi:MAG: hypothetical protein QOI65_611 [Thermoleophilaceae bacterium]|jgi:hypothetical protein|nr:hypothetical protein [Thermoleophilaceae bacterium]